MLATHDLLTRGPDDGNWGDVLSRGARARRRRQASVLVVLTVTVAVVIASAYAFGYPIVDFGSAPRGPQKVVNDFGSLEVGAPAGMAPGVLPEEARRITSVRVDGKEHVLWVAPTKQGGFCAFWSDVMGGCRANSHDDFAKHIDVGGNRELLAGSFFQEAGSMLEVEYQDGTTSEVSFVWVTAPIDAAFYLYRVPDAHRVDGHRPSAMRLLDDEGKVIAKEPIPFAGERPPPLVMRKLPGYMPMSVPPEAIWDKREQLFDARTDDHYRLGLWIAPERGGGMCYWTTQGGGCTHGNDRALPHMRALELGFSAGAGHVALEGRVGRLIARVEARFEAGARAELTPKRGYLLWPIPSRHYSRGSRLVELIGFDAEGRQVASQTFSSDQRGLYPCAAPKDYGYGVKMCP